MQGALLQVNVSPGGVPKRPVPEAFLGPLGLEGDAVAHPESHGGPRQAVLLLPVEAIDELKAAGFPVYPGALGENLTTSGLDRRRFRAGQRFRVGDAIIEITRLRQPCKTISVYGKGIEKATFDAQAEAGDPSSPKWGLAGFYASVLTPGRVSAGCPIMLLATPV